MYADQFYGEPEFERLFDLTLWRQCRTKYHAEANFPTLWNKVKAEVDIVTEGDRVLFPDTKKKA